MAYNSAGLPREIALRRSVGRPLRFGPLGPIELGQGQWREEWKELRSGFVMTVRKGGTGFPDRSFGSSARYLKRIVKRIVAFCAPFELGLQYYSDFLMRC